MVKMLSFFDARGGTELSEYNNFSKKIALVANGVMDDFFYLEITPMYIVCLI